MLEIFALPYFVVSGVIGWVIFYPFFRHGDLEGLSVASIAITDLLAVAIPASVVFALTRWLVPSNLLLQPFVQAIVVVVTVLYAVVALIAGLLLVPKTFQVTFLKRMTIVGIIAPFGLLLTIGWVWVLLWPCAYSMLYLPVSSIAIVATTAGLRTLAGWVCQADSDIVQPITDLSG